MNKLSDKGKRILPLNIRHVTPILPLVYDESLSYYECICKFTKKLNEVIKQINENTEATAQVIQLVNEIRNQWENYKTKIDEFIENTEAKISSLESDWDSYKSQFDIIISEWATYKQKIDDIIKKINSLIVQETGEQTDKVMSQKAVTDELNKKQNVGDYATRAELTAGLETKQNVGDYATRTELQEELDKKQNVGDYATKAELQAGLDSKQPVGDYATKTDLSSKVDKSEVVQTTGESTSDIMSQKAVTDALKGVQPSGDFVTKEQFNNALAGKVDKTSIVQTTGQGTDVIMSQKAVTDALSGVEPSGDYVTQEEFESALAGKQDAGEYVTETAFNQALAGKQDAGEYATKDEVNELKSSKVSGYDVKSVRVTAQSANVTIIPDSASTAETMEINVDDDDVPFADVIAISARINYLTSGLSKFTHANMLPVGKNFDLEGNIFDVSFLAGVATNVYGSCRAFYGNGAHKIDISIANPTDNCTVTNFEVIYTYTYLIRE